MDNQVTKVEVMNTNPAQVCVTYSDGTLTVMSQADWNRLNS